MKKIEINFEKFDFKSLVETTLEFGEKNFEPYFAIPWIYEVGGIPYYGKDENDEIENYDEVPKNIDRDFLKELTNEEKLLFFTFSMTNVGDPIDCADGKAYEIDDEAELNKDFGLGDVECLGYLLKYNAGILTIQSALNSGGACMCPPSISIIEDCGVFEEPMYKFIKMFIKGDI